MLLDILCRNKKTFAILLLSMALLSLVYYFTPFFNVMFLNKNKEQFFSLIETIISFSSITTAFLFFGVSFIPLISDDNKIMKVFRNKEKNYEEFIICAIQFLLVSTISISLYIFYLVELPIIIINILLGCMLAFLVSSIINMLFLFKDLLMDISKKIRND
ncbi:TPA: hypothetical protein I1714_001969 [Staphylococcus pseudintermedius]|uniref:hypothetical protein n=2 Tax=Staphylococcus pseudintermedius TaxID=283734 RepID=UPI000C1BA316|nr:hypothetical protein [Staphylococcus pseudintermedius]AZB66544.1 hypothetical protein [Staphylococcus phage phiSP15-1]EHT3202788.1 hypothetical protein [Staphylococcus pseudintermedius]ELP8736768.1 hypothetical protein [Staphylococcus pseudintermedius]MCE5653923.1 hypothetical protein [Staphylococcus pseudintermedius]POY98982.1 hypothetical protein CVM48_03770 [Staphylococcus pseudintermedius]